MIKLAQLRKEFEDLVAVYDLDLVIPEGEIYGLIGPNGAGKTSTLRMACGLLAPTSGTVQISGIDVHRYPEQAHQFIGYLSDSFALYDELTVWEYLDYFARAYKMPEVEIPSRIDEVIELVGLESKRDKLIRGLSRGMQQRLGIGRAMVHRPKVLLLDEPASGLDPKARLDLRNLLLSLRDQGTTVLISSHILSELDGFCTSIGVMERGCMIRSGTLGEITGAEGRTLLVRVKWVGDHAERVASGLRADPRISGLGIEGTEGVFQFAGAEEELATVLADLVAGGIRVIAFGEVKQTVEDLYMKLSHHEVT